MPSRPRRHRSRFRPPRRRGTQGLAPCCQDISAPVFPVVLQFRPPRRVSAQEDTRWWKRRGSEFKGPGFRRGPAVYEPGRPEGALHVCEPEFSSLKTQMGETIDSPAGLLGGIWGLWVSGCWVLGLAAWWGLSTVKGKPRQRTECPGKTGQPEQRRGGTLSPSLPSSSPPPTFSLSLPTSKQKKKEKKKDTRTLIGEKSENTERL